MTVWAYYKEISWVVTDARIEVVHLKIWPTAVLFEGKRTKLTSAAMQLAKKDTNC
jgi:hypothetical protein